MGVLLGDTFPDFSADTSEGKIQFHSWLGNSWGILFSHPADFTPVCTTELARVVEMKGEFEKRGVKLIALSCDTVESHKGWAGDVLSICKDKCSKLPYPIIADVKRELAKKFGMIDPDESKGAGKTLTARAVFIIGPDKKMKLSILYPATTGRNFDEILRVVDSLQLTASKSVATPADWTPGKECMVVPKLSDEEAKKQFPEFYKKDVPSGKDYLRFTKV